MRRCISLLLVALMMLGGFALAQDGWPGASLGSMRVVNCADWVSLRASPDTSAEALARIPLGMWVNNCAPASGDFIYCEYDGVGGYVLSRYLSRPEFVLCTAGEGTQGTPIRTSSSDFGERAWTFSDARGAYTLHCARNYGAEREELYVSCFDANGGFIWGLYTASLGMTELDSTSAYPGGTADDPLAMVHNFDLGLIAIEMSTGRPRWTLEHSDIDLGAGQTSAVGEDGTLYVGGYYGPSPVAISKDGQVLWQSDAGYDAVWLCGLHVEGDTLVADYDAPDGDGYSRVVFDLATGAVLEAR